MSSVDPPVAQRRPLNPLLASYYSSTTGQLPSTAELSPYVRQNDPTDLDSSSFDVEKTLNIILNEKSLPNLLKRDNELILEMKHIDGDRKTLIYENYAKLIDASDTIKSMREKVESIELEMGKLSVQVQDITSLAANLHGTFTYRKGQVNELKSAVTLVNRLQVLTTLPRRLAQSLKDGSYLRNVQFYSASKATLDKYTHLPAFAKVAAKCTSLILSIRNNILSTLDRPTDTSLLLEYINVLIAIDMDTPDQLLQWFCLGVLETMTTKIKADQPWVIALEQLIGHFRGTFLFHKDPTLPASPVPLATLPSPAEERPKLGPRSPSLNSHGSSPTSSSKPMAIPAPVAIIHLSPVQSQSFEDQLCDLIKQAFDLWDQHSIDMPLSDRLSIHRELLGDMAHIPNIAPVLCVSITQSTETIITRSVLSIVSEATVPVLAEIHKIANLAVSNGSLPIGLTPVMDMIRSKIALVAEQANQVQIQHVFNDPTTLEESATKTETELNSKYKAWELEKQKIQALINQAPFQFIDLLIQDPKAGEYRQMDTIGSTKELIRLRVAEIIADGGISKEVGALDAERVAVHAMKINEHGLIEWIQMHVVKIEAEVIKIGTPTMSVHPKGVEVEWSRLMNEVEALIGTLKLIYEDESSESQTPGEFSGSGGHVPPRRHHRASSSVTSVGSTHRGGGSSVNLSHQERMQLGKHKLYMDRTLYYPQVAEFDGTVTGVVLTLLRVLVKTWIETVRVGTLNKLEFQQVLVNVEFVRICVKRTCTKAVAADKVLVQLLDEVVTSAYRRCVDPVFLSRDAIATLLASAERVEEE